MKRTIKVFNNIYISILIYHSIYASFEAQKSISDIKYIAESFYIFLPSGTITILEILHWFCERARFFQL